MQNTIPKTAPFLLSLVYRKVFPQVSKELNYWKKRANSIPNDELREQALASIQSKRFHCQGGGVYSILAGHRWQEAIKFIVAYQTISDYLDNLCDRSTSLDPRDFRMLHQSMEDALLPENELKNYYTYRKEQNDGEYLSDLVRTCQTCLRQIEDYNLIKKYNLHLEQLYSDLQVHKHVKEEERIPRLEKWHLRYKDKYPTLDWYEFSASSGSTLGIFCLVSYALGQQMNEDLAEKVCVSYFPYMQGLHILLDYYIDQQEDLIEGDLNFCSYYKDKDHLKKRFLFFIDKTNENIQILPHRHFHEMVHSGLVGLYLADPKVKKLENGREITKTLLQASGMRSTFFYFNVRLYNKLKKR
ncbi:tetraprenyl-beta-curcumene synthase family protein [Aquibacillus rhizosphaerae]|uniref:Tetraprenyl-beta-curcumene synthase family protein n=1 Tax=Aquibacillus rhizosphaerae TaxID=3051431 RepID=A0ABT7L9N1_9BACI|nr:tetraprenyl-beta-curcumene synthase family protein [Aquibacillus sp. LR5S19]MDL4842577.1 tetraprenyl-beta-curcumene synthase family protein [Aquibacillus sp. LR5S19]